MRNCTFACLIAAMTLTGVAHGAEKIVKIGSVAPISGPSVHLGKDTENGARMAIDDLNASGFSIDGKAVRLVLVAEDDGGDPKQGTAVAQKLVDANVVGIVGHLNSGTTVPASKIYYNAGIAQITPAATTPQYTRQGFKSAFRVVANDSKVGSALGRYAATRLKAMRIAVIDDRTAFAMAMQKARSSDPDKFVPEIAKIKYRGITGDIAFDVHGDLIDAALTFYIP